MKIAILRFFYFLILFSQLLSSAAYAHIDTEHKLNINSNCEHTAQSLTTEETKTDSSSDVHSSHHCCSICHIHNVSIFSVTESPNIKSLQHKNSLSFYYSNSYFSLIQFSVFRPPIA